MKIVLFIAGMALFTAGIYLSSLSFINFSSLELSTFALYVGGSFVSMTLGLYVALVVFVRKGPKIHISQTKELDMDEDGDVVKTETLDIESDDQDALDATRVLFQSDLEPSLDETKILIKSSIDEEPKVSMDDTIVLPTQKPEVQKLDLFDEKEDKLPSTEDDLTIDEAEVEFTEAEDEIEEETTQTLKNFYGDQPDSTLEDEPAVDILDARLIGIESWGVQRILKKITEDAEVELRMNQKHGLKMAEIFYENKSIGYLSKVDYNKMEDKLPRLHKITVSTIVQESRAVDTVILRFYFRLN